jgi:putative SOS response-associated peptidase YedK
MCGRYALKLLSAFLDEFPWILPPTGVPEGGGDGRYNIAPTQPVAAVLGGDAPHVEFVKWGLVPSWAKDPAVGNKMINARAETLGGRPAFRRLVANRRCLVPADGFYEWKTEGKRKTPYYVHLKSGRPFALAGLWDEWRDPATGAPLKSCTIITAEPNAVVGALHTRMAVIVRPDEYRRWLANGPLSAEELAKVFSPYPAEAMEAYPVSPAVNSPRGEGPALTRPAGPAVAEQPTLF